MLFSNRNRKRLSHAESGLYVVVDATKAITTKKENAARRMAAKRFVLLFWKKTYSESFGEATSDTVPIR